MRQNLALYPVLERGDDRSSVGVVLGVGCEHVSTSELSILTFTHKKVVSYFFTPEIWTASSLHTSSTTCQTITTIDLNCVRDSSRSVNDVM